MANNNIMSIGAILNPMSISFLLNAPEPAPAPAPTPTPTPAPTPAPSPATEYLFGPGTHNGFTPINALPHQITPSVSPTLVAPAPAANAAALAGRSAPVPRFTLASLGFTPREFGPVFSAPGAVLAPQTWGNHHRGVRPCPMNRLYYALLAAIPGGQATKTELRLLGEEWEPRLVFNPDGTERSGTLRDDSCRHSLTVNRYFESLGKTSDSEPGLWRLATPEEGEEQTKYTEQRKLNLAAGKKAGNSKRPHDGGGEVSSSASKRVVS